MLTGAYENFSDVSGPFASGFRSGNAYCTRPPGPELRYGLVKLYFELHIPKLVSEILEFVVIVSSRSRKC